jgi:pimeloyl-ACP methyl ester carboxylesterase
MKTGTVRALSTISLAFAALGALASQAQSTTTYVLVHGAWSGQYAWRATKPFLERGGNTVLTLDLPAHGDDRSAIENASLESYKNAVITTIGERKNVVLVGHSFGGMVISAVAEAVPEKIAKLVYVAAYLPRNGESLFALSQEDKNSKVGQYWNQTSPEAAGIKAQGLIEVFCADCPLPWQQTLLRKNRLEPIAPLATPVALSPERFGSVPRYYLETLQDNAVSHALQKLMLSRSSVVKSVAMNTSHLPFLSQPKAFADALGGL